MNYELVVAAVSIYVIVSGVGLGAMIVWGVGQTGIGHFCLGQSMKDLQLAHPNLPILETGAARKTPGNRAPRSPPPTITEYRIMEEARKLGLLREVRDQQVRRLANLPQANMIIDTLHTAHGISGNLVSYLPTGDSLASKMNMRADGLIRDDTGNIGAAVSGGVLSCGAGFRKKRP